MYRKGIDLQKIVIPALCRNFRHVRFIIGGDGPKRQALVDMQQYHRLEGRVQLVGQVQHEAARDLLVQGAPSAPPSSLPRFGLVRRAHWRDLSTECLAIA